MTAGPLCKVCAKPVPKHVIFKSWNYGDESAPRSKEEAAARFGNYRMLSCVVSDSSLIGPYVQFANFWDGETYKWGGHFHAQGCAAQFGKDMADQFPNWATPTYREAMKARAAA